jgi:hypothetical protein
MLGLVVRMNSCYFSKPTDFCNRYGICLFEVGTEFQLLDLCFKELLSKNFIIRTSSNTSHTVEFHYKKF